MISLITPTLTSTNKFGVMNHLNNILINFRIKKIFSIYQEIVDFMIAK
jgi:hypothetical protein